MYTRLYEVTEAELLEQASQRHKVYYHDLEVISLDPGRVELGQGIT